MTARHMGRFARIAATTFFALAAGCGADRLAAPGAPPAAQTLRPDPLEGPLGLRLSKRFTGRDSFGVAVRANVSLVPTDDGGYAGTGVGTHLGRMHVEQEQEVSGSKVKGAFSFHGETGSDLHGIFEGLAEPSGEGDRIVSAKVRFVDGTLHFTNEDVFGRATLQGVIRETGAFEYALDGWLLRQTR